MKAVLTLFFHRLTWGDKDQALAAILRLWRQNRRTQYLSMASKWEANYTRQNATFEQLAAQLDFDIDSVLYFAQLANTLC
jgi:hypothetical protein